MTTTAAITVAALRGGLITANQGGGGAATYTMPTGTAIDTAFGGSANLAVGDSFDFVITNISTNAAEDVTVAGDTGSTMTDGGSLTVASNDGVTSISSATFRMVRTGTNAWQGYRMS